jgi:uncharacterized membrane protein YeaQ/YmgE (transglycosylase-associated protein family)
MLALGCVVCLLMIGLVAGTVIRPRHPGPYSLGRLTTILLGITGSLLGAGAAYIVGFGISPTHAASWIMSVIGAVALVSVPAFTDRGWSTG